MNQKIKVTIAAAFLVAVSTLVFSTSANNGGTEGKAFNPEKRAEIHAEMQEVMASGDYDAWVELVSECPRGEKMLEVINEDNFGRLAEAHNLKMQAKELMEESRAIMEELGLDKGRFQNGMHKGMGKRGGKFGGFGGQNK